MATTCTGEGTFTVGTPTVIQGPSPLTKRAVVFEDDGETGYFYGVDTSGREDKILDALHIYDVSTIADGDQPSRFELVWSKDGMKAALLINRYPHAIFDFESCRGYCRNGFPEPNQEWTRFPHDWDDAALSLFR